MTNVFGDGNLFQEYPVLETVANIVQAFKRITVDGEAIIIDHANHQTNAEDMKRLSK